MRVVIPDSHLQVRKLDKIFNEWYNDSNTIIMLGDFPDDFGDSTKQTLDMMIWLEKALDLPNVIALIGNHDLSFMVKPSRCSGWTREKQNVIDPFIPKMRKKMQFFHYEVIGDRQFLISHAGLHPRFLPPLLDLEKLPEFLEEESKFAKECLVTEFPHWFFHAGMSRGGPYPVGGPLWMDWSEFKPIDGLNQLIGHSRGTKVRKKMGQFSENYCLDTHLNHFATIDDDGNVEIHEVK